MILSTIHELDGWPHRNQQQQQQQRYQQKTSVHQQFESSNAIVYFRRTMSQLFQDVVRFLREANSIWELSAALLTKFSELTIEIEENQPPAKEAYVLYYDEMRDHFADFPEEQTKYFHFAVDFIIQMLHFYHMRYFHAYPTCIICGSFEAVQRTRRESVVSSDLQSPPLTPVSPTDWKELR